MFFYLISNLSNLLQKRLYKDNLLFFTLHFMINNNSIFISFTGAKYIVL
ncbi:hypothetical protein CUW_2853 [Turicibacter sanguinis PC909]|uniref:Uncharacterized protein n=1 Tax=Turicibacter sanguinis PC909 TaxID=702450 RepID=A0ABP2I1L3_9FIRM|nr:hypothetical protein CUW_2853 [Turicibacter sanguinis PC909]